MQEKRAAYFDCMARPRSLNIHLFAFLYMHFIWSNNPFLDMGGGSVDLTPLPWNHHGFSIKEVVNVDGDEFNVYRTGGEGVAIFCLHGAGYTGLSFARLAVSFILILLSLYPIG